MPLDPEAQAFVDLLAKFDSVGIDVMGPELARQSYAGMTAPVVGSEVASIEDRTIPGPGGDLPVRVYVPIGEGPFPLHLTFHGGGFVLGTRDTHQAIAQSICAGSGSVVVSVDYRLAPEDPYPAGVEDCYAATVWAAEHADELGADPSRLTLSGDSAGGHFVAVVSAMARDRGGPEISLQVLLYPTIEPYSTRPSRAENAEGYYLTDKTMNWFHDQYLQGRPIEPYNNPMLDEHLGDLPPTLVITAEYDPLRDEGEAYAAALQEAGVPVTVTRYEGMIHGFASMPTLISRARDAHAQVCTAITAAVGTA